MYTNMYIFIFIVCLNTITSMINTNVFFDFRCGKSLGKRSGKWHGSANVVRWPGTWMINDQWSVWMINDLCEWSMINDATGTTLNVFVQESRSQCIKDRLASALAVEQVCLDLSEGLTHYDLTFFLLSMFDPCLTHIGWWSGCSRTTRRVTRPTKERGTRPAWPCWRWWRRPLPNWNPAWPPWRRCPSLPNSATNKPWKTSGKRCGWRSRWVFSFFRFFVFLFFWPYL